MKKFTKKLTKAVLTLAAVLAFNAYAGDTATPTYSLQHYDSQSFPGVLEFPSDLPVSGNKTGVWLDDVLGLFKNRTTITLAEEYGVYSKNTDNTVVINNYGNISGKWAGINLVGTNGNLNNYGVISSNDYGIIVDPETGTSNIIDFWIKNTGTITSSNIAIIQTNDKKNMHINNTSTGNITGNFYGIYAKNHLELNNDGLIQAQGSSGIFLMDGGVITNNGIIKTENLASYAKAIHHLGINGNQLTLKGSGRYEGNITYGGRPEYVMTRGVLSIESDGIDFRNSRLENWGVINVDGGNHYFNVENEARNADEPFTYVYAKNNAYVHTGAGSWGDAHFNLDENSLLNPFKNQYDGNGNYWDKPASELNTGKVLYDRKEYEKLIVRSLTMKNGSALVMDVRYSEPDYNPSDSLLDEDERFDYWDSLNLSPGQTNPDGSYAGYGYSRRTKKVDDSDPGDLYTFQRVNYDKIDVAETTDIQSGTKLYLLDATKWLDADGEIPEFVDNILDNLEVDLFDGNIELNDFEIDYYSDYYGIDHVDNNTGTVYLSRNAYDSNVKGQIDWWLKQASLGFAELNPPAATVANQVASANSMAQSSSSVIVTDDGNVGTLATAYNDDDDEDEDAEDAARKAAKQAKQDKLLPYQVAKAYNIKITDLDPTLELKNTIHSFQSWDDVDALMDTLNKLEYASLATSNINAINSRVSNIYSHMGTEYRNENGVALWTDFYYANNSLDGQGNHDISSSSSETTAGIDKMFQDNFILGLSGTYLNYNTNVNDSGVHTGIDSEGFGLNLYGTYKAGAWTHKAVVGYALIDNKTNNDIADFGSSEMFAAYRTEYKIERPGFDVTWIAGLRFANVKYDEIREDAENGLEGFDHNSLESELGVKLSRQFKKLGINVGAAWMHEMMDTKTTATAYTSFGSFEQDGIERSADRLRLSIGAQYRITDNVTFDLDLGKDLSSNSESHSVNGKLTFRF